VLALWVGMIANRHSRRRLLLAAALLMMATGVGFALTTAFWPLLVIAFVGTMNPTSGDASVFAPLEQTVLTQTVEPRRRTALFARYSLIGPLAGALGVLAAAAPDLAVNWTGCSLAAAMQAIFGLYAGIGIVSLLLYRPLSPAIEATYEVPPAPLQQSRRLVYCMAVITPEERPAAASVTAVPKTFACGAGSIISRYLLTLSTFGWPLLIAGMIKGTYDILLLIKFQKVRPPEEAGVAAG
jgi:MFS family permease